MKVSEHWLREWITMDLTREALCERLTLSGLEVESCNPAAEKFSDVVIAKILQVAKHPEADHLQVCEISIGNETLSNIVSGAQNIKPGMHVAFAGEGAVLPNGLTITVNKIRNVVSRGMLCSARELGLAESSEEVFEFPADAPIGKNVWDYLQLSDYVIDVSITPNRGDCLSVQGLAYEISALTDTSLADKKFPVISASIKDALTIAIKQPEECPRYVGRVIRNVKADAKTPVWLQERLRRSGVRCISPVVDVTNYVMLELGQPMHAFDLAAISGNIQVRMATGETLELLDGKTVTLDDETLIIADDHKPLNIAGVMGGMSSAVTLLTQDIFLESAFFNSTCVARQCRLYQLNSESSHRFERGIDPLLQKKAIERATELILMICGGKAGPVIDVSHDKLLPMPAVIHLRQARIEKILGFSIAAKSIENILTRLGFKLKKNKEGWQVTVPARRTDITLEIDLIEEIIRLYGYDKLPTHTLTAGLTMQPVSEKILSQDAISATLQDLGFHEIISYSFIDKKSHDLFNPHVPPKILVNPITADMTVMRASLLPGLVKTLQYNQNRQRLRVRLFEIGLRFLQRDGRVLQEMMLGGLVSGLTWPKQWGAEKRMVDFFDLKGDLENLFQRTFATGQFSFKAGEHPALHPGQTAYIYREDRIIGVIGALHPLVLQTLDLGDKPMVFELALDELMPASTPIFADFSRFPEIERDLALIVDQTVTADDIKRRIIDSAGELLKNIKIFDIYQGQGIASGKKSIALALTLQHSCRTLMDSEVAQLMDRVVTDLKETFSAELRG